jgi:hypothetical protein
MKTTSNKPIAREIAGICLLIAGVSMLVSVLTAVLESGSFLDVAEIVPIAA